jgi:hypothetical protein
VGQPGQRAAVTGPWRTRPTGRALTLALALLVQGLAAVAGAQARPSPAPPSPTPSASTSPVALFTTDTTLIPVLDRPRAVDAEIRASLFDLMTDRPLRALARLRQLDATGVDSGAWRGAPERRFLIAECYYRLAMDDSLRSAAEAALAGPGGARFAPVLRPQLLLAAYRDADYARVLELARTVQSAGNGATPLFAGLAAYRLGDDQLARASFEDARHAAAGGPYETLAAYMSAIMTLKADTTKIAAAVLAIDSMLPAAQGAAAEQLRLTLAQLDYEGGQYDHAISDVTSLAPGSALAAPALLTTAWAQYRAGHVQPAADAFARFAREYPELPGRDESRLMYAQSALQLHHEDSAASAFRAVADSVTAEAAALGVGGSGMRGGGRLLVNTRVAGLLLLGDVAGGKAMAFPDSAAAGNDALRVAVADSVGVAPVVPVPTPVSVNTLVHRLDVAGVDSAGVARAGVAAGALLLRRALFVPSHDSATQAQLARGIAAVRDADVAVGLVREEGRTRDTSVALELANLHRMREIIAEAGDSLGPEFAKLTAQEDSLAQVSATVDSAGVRLGRLFDAQITALRTLASENEASIDSVGRSLRGSRTSDDDDYLAEERESAATYGRIADEIAAGVPAAITRNPAFAQRDTVRQLGERIRALIVQTRQAVNAGELAVDSQSARIAAGEMGGRGSYRQALALAEARQQAATDALVTDVDRELATRAAALLVELTRDREAAEFGSASALFFRAINPQATAPSEDAPGTGTGTTPGTAPVPPPPAPPGSE